MKQEYREKIYNTYTKLGLDVPYDLINEIEETYYKSVGDVREDIFSYDRQPDLDTKIKALIDNLKKEVNSQETRTKNPDKAEDAYKSGIRHVQNVHKLMTLKTSEMIFFHKKISFICASNTKRFLSRTARVNPCLKSRRINKEITLLNKRKDKEKREYTRKAEKVALETKKIEEENKEMLRQKRKFEYLLSQTELFSQFMLGKKNLDNIDNTDKNNEYKDISEKFKMAAIKQQNLKQNIEKDFDKKTDATTTTQEFLPQPKMLNCTLKKYQLNGFNWLVKLYDKGINGILADDMGLGKTVQSIAFLAYLAETEDIWGPFLVITPSSTLHNWDQELKRFVPNFKVLNYWGNTIVRSQAKNEIKKSNFVLTSYQIAVADFKTLRKTKWMYMILDEAQAIKSSTSKRWNTLLSLKTRNRLLLTGTPIQNTMGELWALLHFIMPTLFDSLAEFSEWFSKGIEESAERKKVVDEMQLRKLHAILKPFMLRRLKSDVKTELGTKTEIELFCELSPRQKILYESIVAACKSYEMENVIMQLRKVCNHPDLFEKLETTTKINFFKSEEEGSSLEIGKSKISYRIPTLIAKDAVERANSELDKRLKAIKFRIERYMVDSYNNDKNSKHISFGSTKYLYRNSLDYINGNNFITNLEDLVHACHEKSRRNIFKQEAIKRHVVEVIDNSVTRLGTLPVNTKIFVSSYPYIYSYNSDYPLKIEMNKNETSMIKTTINNVVYEPPLDTFIVDSGKLVLLDKLLPKLKAEGHRILLYFQMTRMMDLVEDYLVKREYSYCRLDGSSRISSRKELVNDWQTGDKFIFLLSTRAGGLGINLTAADTVIFFDSDWNPTVDQQAMDRAYRLGQTKDVTVYRLITKDTIEERVMEKANKKGEIQKMVIKGKVFEGFDM